MSEDNSLCDSLSPSSPPPNVPPPGSLTGVQCPLLENGKTLDVNLSLSPTSDTSSAKPGSLEPEMTSTEADPASQNDESEIVHDETTELPSPPSEVYPKENLPVEVTILGEGYDITEEEPTPSPSKIVKDKSNEGEQDVDERQDAVDEDCYAMISPNPEVEVLVVTTDEERAAEVARTRLEDNAKYVYPVDQGVMKPTFPSPASTLEQTTSKKDSDTGYDDAEAEQPTTGIERPVQKTGNPKTVVIVRLIENTDKRGNNIKSAIRLRKHYFNTDFGDFLLDLSGPRTDIAQVRNYAGQERYIPRRMLQNVYQPWDIPAKTKVVDGGIPLPLAFLNLDVTAEEAAGSVDFEDEEPVMIMSVLDGSNDQEVQVTDWERKAGRLSLKQLSRQYEKPWGILIDRDALVNAWSKAAAPRLPKLKAMGKRMKRKRKPENGDSYVDELDELDEVGEGHSKTSADKQATKTRKEDEMDDCAAVNDPSDDEPTSSTSARKKSTFQPLTKRTKLNVAIRSEDVEAIEAAKRKRPATNTTAGKMPAGKTTSGKKPAGKTHLGKKPVKTTTAAKKTTKGHRALVEAVAEEEESGDEDMTKVPA
ncbi:hypothetical protein BKA64DRAFT_212667 [Cadophora sp. MPI-SDFR-AT-0126]|nr:hypothetical protein BKA64DRAFT_212667 [Leotiomycetes sp. MPI-SDFR-AT-0126]